MTVDNGKRKTFINKLLYVFKPKPSWDIVACAEKIIDDYTGLTTLRSRRRERRLRNVLLAAVVLCIAILAGLIFAFNH